MTTIDDRMTAAIEELGQSLEGLPEREFRPAATRLTNLLIAVVGAVVVLLAVAIPLWLTSANSVDVIETPPSTTATPTTSNAIRLARLDGMALITPVVLDDGVIVARASVFEATDDPPQPGISRSTDGGQTWTFIPTDETVIFTSPGLAAVGNVLVGPVWDGRTGTVSVVTSPDRGQTWSVVELPVPEDYLAIGMPASVVIDEAGRFVVYGGHGKWVSTDGTNWVAGLQDTIGRSYAWIPAMVDGVLVVVGADDRIYAAEPDAPLEVVLEPDTELPRLAASGDRVVASARIPSDSDRAGTWIGVTSDGRTWSEHLSDLSFTVVEPLSEAVGAGYLAAETDPVSGMSTLYRSFDLDHWATVAVLEHGASTGVFDFVEVDGGVLAIVWGNQQTIWRIDLES